MITDKDMEDAKIICSAIKIPIELSIGGLKIVTTVSTGEILAKMNSDTIAQILYGIRAESAEQARKEAAERVAYAWREHGEDITLRIIHDAILSTVNESFTVAHVYTDSEKLAIAVKALESASIGLAVRDGDYETLSLIRQALKEIQG